MLTETEKAYLAGFFDGDGCVNIGTRQGKQSATVSHYLQVIFSQANYEFLMRWRDNLDMGSVHEDTGKKKIPMRQRLWHWRLYDKQGESVLKMMLPYLDIKKTQADIALLFRATMGRGGNRGGTPRYMLALREAYKQKLSAAKRGECVELTEAQQRLESQLREYQLALRSSNYERL